MKKLYAFLLAGVLTVAAVLPVGAAPSPQAAVVEAGKTVQTTVAGAKMEVPTAVVAKEVAEVTSTPSVLADLGVNAAAKLSAVVEVNYDGAISAGGVQIPFVVNSAKAGDYVYVLHRQSVAPFQWEVVGQGTLGADKSIVGTFTSFSPVAFMVVDAANVASAGVKAPKTGEF